MGRYSLEKKSTNPFEKEEGDDTGRDSEGCLGKNLSLPRGIRFDTGVTPARSKSAKKKDCRRRVGIQRRRSELTRIKKPDKKNDSKASGGSWEVKLMPRFMEKKRAGECIGYPLQSAESLGKFAQSVRVRKKRLQEKELIKDIVGSR